MRIYIIRRWPEPNELTSVISCMLWERLFQEKKAKKASLTQATISFDTPVESSLEIDPIPESETPITSATRAIFLQLKATDKNIPFDNVSQTSDSTERQWQGLSQQFCTNRQTYQHVGKPLR